MFKLLTLFLVSKLFHLFHIGSILGGDLNEYRGKNLEIQDKYPSDLVKESAQKANLDADPELKGADGKNQEIVESNEEDKKLDKKDWKVNEEINLKLRDYVWVFFVFFVS